MYVCVCVCIDYIFINNLLITECTDYDEDLFQACFKINCITTTVLEHR